MKKPDLMAPPRNPVTADQIRPGDPYEVSEGRLVEVLPTGRRGARGNLVGGMVLDSDPEAAPAGVDAGVSPRPDMLRAPDVAVGGLDADEPGWATSAPALAVEYADVGQDEAELQRKIAELLDAGTRWVWVVRLKGKRHVEVYEAPPSAPSGEPTAEPAEPASSEPSGVRPLVRPTRVAWPGEQLVAPGVLRNPVSVESLYDREAAHEAALRNLLQRKGFESLEDVQAQAHHEGLKTGLERGVERGIEAGMRRGLERGFTDGRQEGLKEGRQEGLKEGLKEGITAGLRCAVVDLCEAFGIEMSPEHEAALAAMTSPEIEVLRAQLKRHHRWPDPRP